MNLQMSAPVLRPEYCYKGLVVLPSGFLKSHPEFSRSEVKAPELRVNIRVEGTILLRRRGSM